MYQLVIIIIIKCENNKQINTINTTIHKYKQSYSINKISLEW